MTNIFKANGSASFLRLGCPSAPFYPLDLLLSMRRIKNPRQRSWLQNGLTNSGY